MRAACNTVAGFARASSQLTLLDSISTVLFPHTVELFHPLLLDLFRARRVVVVSTHFDDACFSLGCFLFALGQGHLINVFTQTTYLACSPRLSLAQPGSQDVRAIRDSEDRIFAELCGLVRHDLGCEEPQLRQRRPTDLSGLRDDIGQIKRPLLDLLADLAKGAGTHRRSLLFVPLGIGRHVNHRAVTRAIVDSLYCVEDDYDVFFYEDLPYARNAVARMAGLVRLEQRVTLAKRYAFPTPWPKKRELLDCYPTQHRVRPRPAYFQPATVMPRGLHEAFWAPSTSRFPVHA